MKKQKTIKNPGLSMDEEMLVWTSCRYCIGRHTYVSTLAPYILKKYYNLMSPEQRAHNAEDIRRQIADKLNFMPFTFRMDPNFKGPHYDPFAYLFQFIEEHNITCMDDLLKYSRIEARPEVWHVGKGPALFDYDMKGEEKYKRDLYVHEFEDLFEWDALASALNVEKHVLVYLKGKEEPVEAFPCWVRKTEPVEDPRNTDKIQYFKNVDFGWEQVLRPLDACIETQSFTRYIPKDMIEKIESVEVAEK